MTYRFITNDVELNQYCEKIQDAKHVSLDSEFVRTKTFYPRLGLLQIFDGHEAVLIDPLTIKNWQFFIDTINNPKIEKYFHACSEDIDVFLHHFGFIPLPILDSQILASFLDNPLSSGYATLVKKYLDNDLDKSETRTDWLKRPLSEKQCQYAANDVLFLSPLMSQLKSKLLDKGWLNAAYEECENAVKRKQVVIQPENAYLQIKNAWQLKADQLGYLKKLAEWRYIYAKTHDIALNFVVHEEVLWKICRYRPKSLAELSALGLKGKEIRLFGDKILATLSKSVDSVEPIKRVVSYPDYKKWATLIKDSAQQIAKKTELSVELLVSRRHIDQFIKWKYAGADELPELVSGWRGELFKPYLL